VSLWPQPSCFELFHLFLTGAELSKSKKELKWEVEDGEDDTMFTEKCLELRQV
jgi:hypothetical protein